MEKKNLPVKPGLLRVGRFPELQPELTLTFFTFSTNFNNLAQSWERTLLLHKTQPQSFNWKFP